MKTYNAQEILEFAINLLLYYVEELSYVTDEADPFAYGEKTAYTECLEIFQYWDKAKDKGLNFDIETRYPL